MLANAARARDTGGMDDLSNEARSPDASRRKQRMRMSDRERSQFRNGMYRSLYLGMIAIVFAVWLVPRMGNGAPKVQFPDPIGEVPTQAVVLAMSAVMFALALRNWWRLRRDG
jgi:hypothetical protein